MLQNVGFCSAATGRRALTLLCNKQLWLRETCVTGVACRCICLPLPSGVCFSLRTGSLHVCSPCSEREQEVLAIFFSKRFQRERSVFLVALLALWLHGEKTWRSSSDDLWVRIGYFQELGKKQSNSWDLGELDH